ncbi:nuclear transport factor 2 family protein [Streptomyces sp. 1222.5]|uniref:nuclear transport factor 2 family protein n=1 Tax=Streptomyces sp. 1222.5 TaxID=1881026 RepID=UPI003D72132E
MTTQTDHTEISMLVDRLFRLLDDRELAPERARDFFTDDALMETPVGVSRGAESLPAAEEALARFDRTQHMASGIVTDADATAERATASWNALMTHVHHEETLRRRGSGADPLFTVGGRFEAELRRTPDGWRFSRLVIRPIWTQGQPPPGVDPR